MMYRTEALRKLTEDVEQDSVTDGDNGRACGCVLEHECTILRRRFRCAGAGDNGDLRYSAVVDKRCLKRLSGVSVKNKNAAVIDGSPETVVSQPFNLDV
jgi:hypothetical protein